MATKIYDLIVAVSTYQDNNGQNKHRWENVGAILQDKDQQGNVYSYAMLKATFNPAGIQRKEGSDSIRITLSKPKEQQQQSQSQAYDNNFNSFGQQVSDCPF